MAQNYIYPAPVTGSLTLDAIGPTGDPIPADAILIGAEDPSGDLEPLQISAGGELLVALSSVPLPTGAATAANQVLEIAELTAINGKLPATLGQKAMAASLAVVLASDQAAIPVSQSGTWNINNISGTISLPTGAATEATLSAMSAKLPATLGQKAMAASLAVVLASDQSSIPVTIASVPLPTGAATEATLLNVLTETTATADNTADILAALPATLGQKAMAASLAVVIASDQSTLPISAASLPLPTGAATEATLAALSAKVTNDYGVASGAVRTAAQVGNASGVADFNDGASGAQTLRVSANIMRDGNDLSYNAGANDANTLRVALSTESKSQTGRSVVTTVRNSYSSVNVTTGAWVELVASLGSTVNMIEIFDSSGQTMEIGIGAAAAETRLLIVFPGGNGQVPVQIASGTRVSIRAVSGTASVGELDVNLYS